MNTRIKRATGLAAVLLTAGSLSAQTSLINATDGTSVNTYGDTQGVAIDFDASSASLADWTPDLGSGLTYSLNSVSLRNGTQANPGGVYLGVYTGFAPQDFGGIYSGFLGTSDNAIDLSTATLDDWATFTFSGINVTADSTVGSGSGLLYFLFQSGTSALTTAETARRIHRFDGETGNMAATLSSVLAFGSMQAARSPEYQASLTVVPEPSAVALISLSGVALLFARRRPNA